MRPMNASMFDLTITRRDTEENGQGEKPEKCDDPLELGKYEAKTSQWIACLWSCQRLGFSSPYQHPSITEMLFLKVKSVADSQTEKQFTLYRSKT